ncbi:uncharacterized protein [Apostichopus japonicus]|uniref:uncharacterized protein isoform X3 n=1 Tax=Stichopus japonicus TaxID=307972 RepID=UPI003AB2700F
MEGKVATDEERPSVQEVKQKFSVFEDGAFAHQVQEELNDEHYQGNISRRRTVRSDRVVAKSQAEEEALEAFREEHEIAERNRQLEEKDNEAAREMYAQLMKEEEEKAKQDQEKDKEIAREMQMKEKEEYIRLKKKQREKENLMESERLARSMSQEDKERSHKQTVTESEDALAALRIAMEDGRQTASPAGLTVDIEGAGENGLPDVTDDALIARQLQEHEKDKFLLAKKKEKERMRLKESERLAKRLQHEERLKAERHRGGPDQPLTHRDGRTMDPENPDEIMIRRVSGPEDDEELARKMQQEEVLKAKSRRRREVERRTDSEISRSEPTDIRNQVSVDDYSSSIVLLSITFTEDDNPMDRERHYQDRGHRTEPERGHRTDPERGHRTDPERGHRTDPERGHRTDPERGHRTEPERGHRTDPERGHRTEPERGHRTDPERGHRTEPERGHRTDSEKIHMYDSDRRHVHRDSRHRDERTASGQTGGVDPRLLERNPMVDAFPHQAADSGRGQSTGHMQPIPGQKRQTAKEREKTKEKDKKSKGLFSKSKKK